MIRLRPVLAALWMFVAVAPAMAAPGRILSLNLCTDQLLLALADRDRIAGLTSNAADPQLSAAADKARGLPLVRPSAEAVLQARPDLILGMEPLPSALLAPLAGEGYPLLQLGAANDYAGIRANIRATAQAIGEEARGRALIAAMDRQLQALPKPGRGRVAAYYQRRGFLTGAGTLIDDLMQRMGLVNLARQLHRPVLSRLSIEELVAAQPDFLIVDSEAPARDEGAAMLQHPALAGIPRLVLPQAWTVCGSPAYVLAAQRLAAGLSH